MIPFICISALCWFSCPQPPRGVTVGSGCSLMLPNHRPILPGPSLGSETHTSGRPELLIGVTSLFIDMKTLHFTTRRNAGQIIGRGAVTSLLASRANTKSIYKQMLARVQEKGTSCLLMSGLIQPPWWLTLWRFLKIKIIELPYDSQSHYRAPERTYNSKDTCIPVFIAALFTEAKTWKGCKCLSADDWLKKM